MSNKKKLNELVNKLGFDRALEITGLKGGSLGQYLDYNSSATLPDYKLRLLELTYDATSSENIHREIDR